MLKVRRAMRGDLKQALQLRLEFYEDHLRYDPLLNPVTKRVRSELTKEVKAYLAGGSSKKALFLAEERSEYLGYVTAMIVKAGGIFKRPTEGFIPNIYVRPSAKRRKVGTALAKQAHSWIRSHGGKVVRLVVYTDNRPGEEFWFGMGYIPHQYRMYTVLK